MGSSPTEASTAMGLPLLGLSSWSQVCWERRRYGELTYRGINGYRSASVSIELLVSGMLGEGAG
jgi:hypothetical protein